MYYIMEMEDADPTLDLEENMPLSNKQVARKSSGHNTINQQAAAMNNNSTTTNNSTAATSQKAAPTNTSSERIKISNLLNKHQSEEDLLMPDNSDFSKGATSALTASLQEANGTTTASSSSSAALTLEELVKPIIDFYNTRTNYDCMPNSGKVIVFDIDLPVKEAFDVAAQNDLSFATLWDSQKHSLVGMITITDLIEILLHFHNRTSVIKELIAEHEIRQMRELGRRNRPEKLVQVTPEDTLLTSIRVLHKNKIHRLPVVSNKGVLLQIITHSHLLAFMVHNISFEAPIFKKSIEELGIGTFKSVITVKPDETVYDILSMFKKHRISAVPIVDKDGSIIDVFSRYDIIYLIREDEDQYCLNKTVEEALKNKPKIPVFTCMRSESLEKVLRHLATTRIHRLVCVDENSMVTGVVSISDVFDFLLRVVEGTVI